MSLRAAPDASAAASSRAVRTAVSQPGSGSSSAARRLGEGLGVGLEAFEVVLVAAARFLVGVVRREVEVPNQVAERGAVPEGSNDVLPLADGGGVGFESEDPAAQRGADAIGGGVGIDARGVRFGSRNGVDEGVEAEVGGERDVAGAEGGQVDRQFPATGSCGQVALFAHGTNPTHEGSEAASLRLPTQCSCRGEGRRFR